MKKLVVCFVVAALAALVLTLAPVASAQTGTTQPGAIGIQSTQTNPWHFRTQRFVCGGQVQAGTPIAGNGTFTSNGTSGTITIAGIPATATIERADLMWTVLTDEDPATTTLGQSIVFNGTPVTGFNIGRAAEGPCFPQANSVAWRAIITHLIVPPGNGAYPVSGFPGGGNFTEGVTLQILWRDANGPLMENNLYHAIPNQALAVTQGNTFTQTMVIGGTNVAGPVSASFYTVFGNGQANGTENLRFDGPVGGDINLDNTLDGSTVAKLPGTCASQNGGSQCFWDDDVHNVSSQMTNAATWAIVSSGGGSDCFTWPAAALVNSTDMATVCHFGGGYVDNQCLPQAPWRNHGEYMSCVSDAAQRYLSGLPYGGTCPRAEIQSCIVNPRARSDVGRK